MFKGILSFVFMAAISAALVSAQQSKLIIPVKSTPADSGKQMYGSYCASCHGLDGRGGGPTAAALTATPTDLTLLARNNKGEFPATHVVAVLKFGPENGIAHGSKQMPIWGPALGGVGRAGAATSENETIRIANLVKYVETLQAK